MAKFFPKFEKIQTLKQKPTDGELHALKVLSDLSDNYEVYFQPFINGHNPDIIVIRKNYDVLIIEAKDWHLNNYQIEVKDWHLNNYQIDEKDNWILCKESIPIKSPIEQVKTYKDDLYDLSIPSLLNLKIKNKACYGIVRTSVYFHNETSSSIKTHGVITDKFCPAYGNNNFTAQKLEKYSLRKRKYPNTCFTYEIYQEF